MRIVLATVAVIGVSGCAANDCGRIKMVDYDQAFQAKLTNEIKEAPAMSAWPTAIVDYRQLREAVRQCQKAAE